MIDPKLKEYATDKQAAYIDAINLHGGFRAAAAVLGVDHSSLSHAMTRVQANAARQGYAPGHFVNGVAPGYQMGKVTVQRGADGNVERVWERQHPEQAALRVAIDEMARSLADSLTPLPTITPPTYTDADLLCVIPMGDPHFGMMAWAAESGDNFDLHIAEQLTFDAVDRLVSLSPPSKTAILLNLGDFFHADNSSNRTPHSGNSLDVDGRFQKIASVGFRAMIRCVTRMLERHENVIVRNNRGNHDPHQAYMLSMAMAAFFHDNPRVSVDMSPSGFWYFRFGEVLIGSVHGDGAKLVDLPSIMACDVKHDWAASTFRVWHCGHFHHDQLKDYRGCTVETHRTLAAKDAWHAYQGYRSYRDMKCIVYHRQFGEVNRIRCNINMIAMQEAA